jgi:hypothetical protein
LPDSQVAVVQIPSGGIYNGVLIVTAVPEPERYAMMRAGLIVMRFLGRRPSSRG